MSNKYLCPCSCGEELTVEVGQAGQMVACPSCGQSFELPTMRGIRELEAVEDQSASDRPTWSPRQGMLFVVGILITLVSLVAVGVLASKLSKMREVTDKPDVTDQTTFDRWLDERTPEETLRYWELVIEAEGLGGFQQPEYIALRRELSIWQFAFFAALAALAGGVACTASAFILKS